MGFDLIFEIDVKDPIKFVLFLQRQGLKCNLVERGTISFAKNTELPILPRGHVGLFKEYVIIAIKENEKKIGEFKFEYVNVLPDDNAKVNRPGFFEKSYGEYLKACLWGDFWAFPINKVLVKVINDKYKNLILSYKDEYPII